MSFERIENKKIYQVIIERIIDLIRTDELRVGEKLPPERELAAKFGVSRPSVREALRVMEVMGLLDRRPGGGSVVTDVNIGGLLNMVAPIFLKREGLAIELVELRYLLETRAAELAASNITDSRAKQLNACIGRMSAAQSKGDAEAEVRADIDFHQSIFSFTDNYALRQAATFVTDLLENSVRFGRRVVLEGGYGDRQLLDQHRRIYESIVAGEPEQARKAMEAHMNLVVEYYLRWAG